MDAACEEPRHCSVSWFLAGSIHMRVRMREYQLELLISTQTLTLYIYLLDGQLLLFFNYTSSVFFSGQALFLEGHPVVWCQIINFTSDFEHKLLQTSQKCSSEAFQERFFVFCCLQWDTLVFQLAHVALIDYFPNLMTASDFDNAREQTSCKISINLRYKLSNN